MRKIILIFLLLTSVMNYSAVAIEKQYKLEFKPFKQAIYHVSSTGIDTPTYSPQILEAGNYNPVDKSFIIKVKHVTRRDDPLHDLSVLSKMKFTNFGSKELLEFEKNKEGAIAGTSLWPFALPIFPENEQGLKLGDVWEVKTFPIAYDMGPYGPVALGENAVIKLEWTDIVDINNFKCAKIKYSIIEQWKDQQTEDILKYNCNGVVYFAINEGVIVAEWLNVAHDLKMYEMKKQINSTMKVRLIHYEAYQEGK